MRIAIIGAGLGGLCAAIQLKQAGYTDIAVFEKETSVGGTWRDNRYPGCACDVPVALYQFSFAPSPNWSHIFPRAAEMGQYTEDLCDWFQLRPHLRLGEELVSAVWDETKAAWTLRTQAGDTHEADVIVPALGQLNRPQWPDIPGRERFKGASMHSARWDARVDLKGKRVACIGSAASAVQLIPEVAKEAARLTVFQRTPNWCIPRHDQEITPEDKTLLMTDPEGAMKLGALNREMIYERADRFFWQAFEWTPEGRAALTRTALDHLHAQVSDPVLRTKLTPDYPVGCKRVLFVDDYYPALQQPNVSLVTERIEKITENAVVTRDGVAHEVDVIVYATGFETTEWHWSLDVHGRGGVHLSEAWKDGPEAYLGILSAGFPNMFMLYGPNTNLGHNSITFMIERQVEYMLKSLAALKERNGRSIAVKTEAQARFNAALQDQLAKTVWADPSCSSWYKNAAGRITQNWGSHCRDYAKATSTVQLTDLELT
jgi:cation diffusion facilitator CzcD-associated flavoprotein CzcO